MRGEQEVNYAKFNIADVKSPWKHAGGHVKEFSSIGKYVCYEHWTVA